MGGHVDDAGSNEISMSTLTPPYDIHRRPIQAGDLLRTFHFTGARRKKYWLYHGVREVNGYLEMVPVHQLATGIKDGGCVWLRGAVESEIIAGTGYEDRKRGRDD